MQVPDEFVTTAEALKILGLTDRSTISRWVQIGRLAPARRATGGPAGAFLFRRTDVEALAEQLAATA
jgi:hypothetical protein